MKFSYSSSRCVQREKRERGSFEISYDSEHNGRDLTRFAYVIRAYCSRVTLYGTGFTRTDPLQFEPVFTVWMHSKLNKTAVKMLLKKKLKTHEQHGLHAVWKWKSYRCARWLVINVCHRELFEMFVFELITYEC
jgi:hypothetical protein